MGIAHFTASIPKGKFRKLSAFRKTEQMKQIERIQDYEGMNRSNRNPHFLVDGSRFLFFTNISALQDL